MIALHHALKAFAFALGGQVNEVAWLDELSGKNFADGQAVELRAFFEAEFLIVIEAGAPAAFTWPCSGL